MTRGTIVLTPFPFTDLSSRKVRPAVVVSHSDRPGRDVVLAFITSRWAKPPLASDLLVPDTHPDFKQTGCKASSVVKFDKLVTLDTSTVLGELGQLSPALLQEAAGKLPYALEL